MPDAIKSAVEHLQEQRDKARDLAVTLENELDAALELVNRLTARIAVLEGRDVE